MNLEKKISCVEKKKGFRAIWIENGNIQLHFRSFMIHFYQSKYAEELEYWKKTNQKDIETDKIINKK